MGYEFALGDTCSLRAIDDLERFRPAFNRNSPEEHCPEDETVQEAFEEALATHSERYEDINFRREEMGMVPISAEELRRMEQHYRDIWFGK